MNLYPPRQLWHDIATQQGLHYANLSQSALGRLPQEVFLMIVAHTARSSLGNLALSCKYLCCIAREMTFYDSIGETGSCTNFLI
jgi:hypothetical protein